MNETTIPTPTTEEKKVDAETVETTEEHTEETTEEAEETSTEETSKKEETVDYKSLYETEQKRADKAESAKAEDAFKGREVKREDPKEEKETNEDKPLTRAELNEVLAKHSQTAQKTTEDSEARRIIDKYTSSADEADAAHLFWKNRVIPTGDLESDVLFALGGMNVKRTQAQVSELKRMHRNQTTVSTDGSSTHRDATGTSKPAMSSADAFILEKAGMVWDAEKKVYSKKLKNGKTFFNDPKKDKRWVE